MQKRSDCLAIEQREFCQILAQPCCRQINPPVPYLRSSYSRGVYAEHMSSAEDAAIAASCGCYSAAIRLAYTAAYSQKAQPY